MAVATISASVSTAIKTWTKQADPITYLSNIPRGRFVAWCPFTTVTGAGAGDNNEFSFDVSFPTNFAYRINTINASFSLESATDAQMDDNWYQGLLELQGVWGPNFANAGGAIYKDQTQFETVSRVQASGSGAASDPGGLARSFNTPWVNYRLNGSRWIMREFQSVVSGSSIPQVSAKAELIVQNLLDNPAAVGDWSYMFYLDAYVYDLAQLEQQDMNIPTIVLG